MIRLSGGLSSRCQVLGTESDNSLTWLWAWAEEQSGSACGAARLFAGDAAWGEKEGITECTSPSVDLDRADGLLLSLIAAGVCKASCHYQDSYDGGALFLLLFGQTIEMQAAPGCRRPGYARSRTWPRSMTSATVTRCSPTWPTTALPTKGAGPVLLTRLASGEELRAEFGPQDRLLSINGRPLLS